MSFFFLKSAFRTHDEYCNEHLIQIQRNHLVIIDVYLKMACFFPFTLLINCQLCHYNNYSSVRIINLAND